MSYSEIYGLIQKTCRTFGVSFSDLSDIQKKDNIRVKYCLIFFLWLKGQLREEKLAEIFGYAQKDNSTISYALNVTRFRVAKWSDWKFCYEHIEWIWDKIQSSGRSFEFYRNGKNSFENEIENRMLNNQLALF